MNAITNLRHSLPVRVGLVKKLAGFTVWNGLTQKTPVDTGRARAAWNLAIGEADLSVPPEGYHATPMPPALGEVAPGVPVIASNNLPYIGELEKGHSTQAPAGFVAMTVQETLAAFDGIVADVKARAERGGLR